MARSHNKAGRLASYLDDVSVEDLDKELVDLGRKWKRIYLNRQLLAQEEGVTTPPPSPPTIESAGESAERPKEIMAPAPSQSLVGSIEELARSYQEDSRSPYHSLQFRTRAHYNVLIRRILTDRGGVFLADVSGQMLEDFYQAWTASGSKKAMGHALMTMLRGLINFGASVLEDPQCERLSGVMRRLKFEYSEPRSVQLTADHAIAIRKKAHELNFPSIALAQAIQFDCRLPQKDVIGDWVPLAEPGNSDIINGDEKWLHGVRWSEISDDLVLRHMLTRQQQEMVVNLRNAPMVMEELSKMGSRPSSGPVIVCEGTLRPWVPTSFRQKWRAIARAAGVPNDVYNKDTSNGPVITSAEEKARRWHRRRDQK